MRRPSPLSGRGSSPAPCIFTCRFLQALLLALGTWLLYVADRILDGLRQRQGELLRERHHFHARHRTAFLWAASLLVLLFAWFVLTRMRPEALRDDSWIGVFALLYLFAVHRRTNRITRQRAPAAQGACRGHSLCRRNRRPRLVSPRRRHGAGLGKEQLAPAVVFFAVLCWINCVGIEKWEAAAHWPARM
jgi:hypothetical protein